MGACVLHVLRVDVVSGSIRGSRPAPTPVWGSAMFSDELLWVICGVSPKVLKVVHTSQVLN